MPQPDLVPGFSAENELERAVASDPDIRRGWGYSERGTGHPERLVGAHVAAILRNIGDEDKLRAPLRFVALVHDSMKWAVRRDLPWSPDNDHAVLARRVAARHTSDHRLLLTIELHDEAFWIFTSKRTDPDALDGLLAQLLDVPLYLRFVELDASNEGKDPTFLMWLRNELALRGLLPAGRAEPPQPDRAGQTIFLMEWETEPDHQRRFASALATAMISAPGAEEWEQREVLRSADGARVVLFGRAPMPTDVALLRGRSFAHALADKVDQTGARMVETRLLETIDPERPTPAGDGVEGR
jgi:hypothetical protein